MNKIMAPLDNDKSEIMRLWKYSFSDTPEFMKYYFSEIYKPENALVYKDSGLLKAALQKNPYTVSLDKKTFDTFYIVGISSFPEYRGFGAVKQLMNQLFSELYEKKVSFILLMAIDYRLYTPYGFAQILDNSIFKFETGELQTFRTKLKSKEIRLGDKDLIEALASYYAAEMDSNSFCVRRTSSSFERLLNELATENGYAYSFYDEEGKLSGYIFYFFDGHSLVVKEILYSDSKALEGILTFLYNHNTQVKKIILHDKKDSLVQELLPDRRKLENAIDPFLTARIINLRKFLEEIRFAEYFQDDFVIKVSDDRIPENNSIITIANQLSVVSLSEAEAPSVDLEIDISLLVQLIFSYIEPQIAKKLKRGYVGFNQEKCDRFFHSFCVKPSFFNEYV